MHVGSLNQWTVVVVVSYTFCTWQFLFLCLRQRIATHGCVGRQPCLQYFHVETKNESQSPKVACGGARQGGCFVFLRNYAFTKIILSLLVSSLRAKLTLNQVSKVSTFDIIENVKNSKYWYRQSQVSNFSIISSIEPALAHSSQWLDSSTGRAADRCSLRVQIPLKSTVFLSMLAMLENLMTFSLQALYRHPVRGSVGETKI